VVGRASVRRREAALAEAARTAQASRAVKTRASRPRTSSGRAQTCLDDLLDAAEEVVLRDGIGHLTLDAVARQARLSKGGLLHHYRTKDALIDALVARCVGGWREECDAAYAAQPPGVGRFPRAVMGHCLGSTEELTDTLRRRGQVLVAAMIHDPSRVEPLRQIRREHIARASADGLPPGVGEAILLALDGLWFEWLFGITEPTEHRQREIRGALERWVDTFTTDTPAPPRRGRPRRKAADRPRARGKD
jgi:AcrR family transcriptional regulator